MSHMLCPRCDSDISTTSWPSDHTGFYISDNLLETLESKIFRGYTDFHDWFDENCQSANHCPYCGYVWSFENEQHRTPGYDLDTARAPSSTWVPQPLVTLECRNPGCADLGGYIKRSQYDIDSQAKHEPFTCHTCHTPYVPKT